MIDKLLDLLEKGFFLDLVATVAPGILFVSGGILLMGGEMPQGLPSWLGPSPWIVLPVAYAAGHLLTAIGESLLAPSLRWLYKRRPLKPRGYMISEEMATRPSVQLIKELIPELQQFDSSNPSVLRNIALTVIRDEDRSTIIRFRAISLFCLGVTTAGLILWFSYAYAELTLAPKGDFRFIAEQFFWVVVLTLVMMRRHFEFASRSEYLQFDILAAQLIAQRGRITGAEKSAESIAAAPAKRALPSSRLTVYLAGGLHSQWQRKVRDAIPEVRYLDPSEHGLIQADAYTAWDLEAVRASDLVFAYLEETNPSGYGLSVELGFARALGKMVVLVDEKSAKEPTLSPRFRIVRAAASVVYSELSDGIAFLKQFARIPQRS